MPRKRKAAPGQEAALQVQQRTDILAEPDHHRKQAALGRCVCGLRVETSTTTLRCATCSAWRRWFSAHRIAVHAAEAID